MKQFILYKSDILPNRLADQNDKLTTGATNKMKTLYFIRHGQTLFNILNKVQGASDSPLTEPGKSSAVHLGEAFKAQNVPFDIAYTSDLGRARNTAQLMIQHSNHPDVPLIETEELREVSFGSYEGGSNDTLWREATREYKKLLVSEASPDEDKIHVLASIKELDKLHFAESFDDVAQRVQRILDQAISTNHTHILLFSHGLFIDCVLYILSEKSMHVTHIPNTSVTKITYDNGQFTINYVGRDKDF